MNKKRSDNKWNRLNVFVNENFKLGLKYVGEIKNYIYFSLAAFLIFGVIGLIFPIFFTEQIIKLIQELIEQTQGLNTIELISFIVTNNMQSAFFGMVLGIIFGIFPLVVLVVNGYILGFVANQVAAAEGGLVLWRLLPHGIFEIPAIMIAVGIGLKLGLFLFISKEKTWKEFKKWIVDALRTFILIVVPLLVIAGIIEGVLIVLLG